MAGLEQQTLRLEARLTALERNNTRLIESVMQRRFSRLGGVVRRQLIETQEAAVLELRRRMRRRAASRAAMPRTDGCRRPCLDAAILYQDVDQQLFTNGGVLHALRTHVLGVRDIYILANSDAPFRHLLDETTVWVNASIVPFTPASIAANTSLTHPGPTALLWLYQQALKFWFVENMPGRCNNVILVDSDTVFLRDFDPVNTTKQADGTCRSRFKYNLATVDSGAWVKDVVNPSIHRFVEYLTGLPKALKDTQTAINHWQIMQRDVLRALARSVKARLDKDSVTTAVVSYGEPSGVSAYEAYFSFVWHYYQNRLDMVHLPYMMRQPASCGYFSAQTRHYANRTSLAYFTCHATYAREDFYANCLGREFQCGPSGELSQ